ncbi:MAG: hypothetical protein IJ151_04825 [Bacteroidales bacterium]|nr:hypothetical protein [Bacteroidales bacterium]
MNVQLYNKTTKTIFLAVLVLAIASIIQPLTNLLGGFQSSVNEVSGAFGGGSSGGFYVVLQWIFNIVVLGSTCLFVWGLFNLKSIVDGPEAQGAVNLVFIAAAVNFLAELLGLFLGGILLGLIGIAVAVLYIIGYSKMKVAPTLPEPAKQGANLLFVGAILQVVAAVIGLIPVIGGILGFLICIAVFVLYIIGWKKVSTPVA